MFPCRIQRWGLGSQLGKVTINISLGPPRFLSSDPLILRHISITSVCNGPSTTKKKKMRKRNKTVHPKSPPVNVFILRFPKPRM